MTTKRITFHLVPALLVAMLTGCAGTRNQSPDISESLRSSLDQAGLKDVKISQDRTKGVVTLSGNVPTEDHKTNAGNIAKNLAGSQVVANEIAVVSPTYSSEAKEMNSAVDEGITANLNAALQRAALADPVKHSVKNKVVTLTGEVNSQQKRAEAERIAAAVPNVDQVVNELQVKNQKATSTTP
jgi:hyperosmotically inducible protein